MLDPEFYVLLEQMDFVEETEFGKLFVQQWTIAFCTQNAT
jgi:hypothetical protein